NAVGNLAITVTNAAPGGGTTAAKTIQVVCDVSGVDYPLAALNAAQTVTLNLLDSTAPTASRIRDTFSTSASCPGVADTTGTEPYRAYVVQNVSTQAATLSAWTVCTGTNDDAFLVFYNNGSVPKTQAQIEACTGSIAEGFNGTGKYGSPEGGASGYCPGL